MILFFWQQKLGTKMVGVVAMDQGLGIEKGGARGVEGGEGHKCVSDRAIPLV
jgi:hypothetical protein